VTAVSVEGEDRAIPDAGLVLVVLLLAKMGRTRLMELQSFSTTSVVPAGSAEGGDSAIPDANSVLDTVRDGPIDAAGMKTLLSVKDPYNTVDK